MLSYLLDLPRTLKQERTARFDFVHNIELVDVVMVVAADEVRPLDVVGTSDRRLGEAQVGLGRAQRLLGVVLEVSLTVHVGLAVDDVHGALVGADSSVASETPELAAYEVVADDLERLSPLPNVVLPSTRIALTFSIQVSRPMR